MPIKGKAGAQFSHYDDVERTGCRFIKGELETEVATRGRSGGSVMLREEVKL